MTGYWKTYLESRPALFYPEKSLLCAEHQFPHLLNEYYITYAIVELGCCDD